MSEDAKRILVVEDEENLRELVRARLEASGYEVAVAADGYKALATAREFHPDLVVLDLMLPKMDGYTVCRMLRSAAEGSEVPIILFSARSAQDDRLRGEEVGANAYVNKPFDAPVLLDKIRELLDPQGWAAAQSEGAGEHHVEAELPTTAEVNGRHSGVYSQAVTEGDIPVTPEGQRRPHSDASGSGSKRREPSGADVGSRDEPKSEAPLTPEEQAARARPATASAPQMTDPLGRSQQEAARVSETPVTVRDQASAEMKPRGFLARLFGRLFRGRKPVGPGGAGTSSPGQSGKN